MMWSKNPETADALRFWLPAALGVLFCIFVGKLAVESASPLFVAFMLSLGAAALTFYSPKLGLGLLVFSMLLSPRLKGAAIGSAGAGGWGGSIELRMDDILLAVVTCAWMARTAVLKRGAFLVSTPIHLPVFVYTCLCVVSTAFAVIRGDLEMARPFFFVLKYVEYFLLFFMTVNVVETREDIRRYLWAAWVVAALVTLYGYVQIPSGQRVSTPFETPIPLTNFRMQEAAVNEANTYGGYFLVVFGVLLALFTQGGARLSRFALLSFLWMLLPFVMSLSRSSYIGLLVLILFFLSATRKKRLSLLAGLGMAGLLTFMTPGVREAAVHRVAETFPAGGWGDSDSGGVRLEASAQARISSAQNVLHRYFTKHPILGVGVTGAGMVDTHLPRVLGETGLLGLWAFLWMILRLVRMGWGLFRSSQDVLSMALGLGLAATTAALCAHSLGANTFIIVRIAEPFWFLAGITARLYMPGRSSEA
ncbi:MAG: O-antigen ligase family protein [Elusimicrobia bacterium]|nr:O-antigen ligase family protein [Elusimicrobiota bacterium]